MTRYDDVGESGGGISLSRHDLPGQPGSGAAHRGGLAGPADAGWDAGGYLGEDGSPDFPPAGFMDPDGPDTGNWNIYRPAATERRGRRSGTRPPRAGVRSRRLHPSRHRVLGGAAVVAMIAVVATSLVAYAKYRGVLSSIQRENVTPDMLGKRPPYTAGLNILIIGSDSRAGLHGFGSGIVGSRSDTSMLLHIAPGHARADIISFPRDSVVPILACSNDGRGHTGQTAAPGEVERLNATFAAGGAPCLWKTLEQETGIRIEHFVEVNFSGFQSIVNDVGGVPVCLPFAINNAQSGLRLSAGKHVVNGGQALAFVRLRENIGEGSDTQRIQRQQYFLAAVMQKLKATNLLAQPNRIYSVVRDVAKSLTVDQGLDLSTMLRIADSMKSLSSSHVQFITVPVVPYPGDPAAELSWEQPQAGRLFRAIEADKNLPKASKGKKGKKGKAVAIPTVSPAQVHVEVLNGSGVTGIAGSTAAALTSKGFQVTGTGPAASYSYTSNVIQYATAAQLPQVNTLKALIGPVAVQQVMTLGTGSVNLILGSNFTGLKTGTGAAAKPSGRSLSDLAKNYSGITASTNICSDSAAFAGPDTPLPGG